MKPCMGTASNESVNLVELLTHWLVLALNEALRSCRKEVKSESTRLVARRAIPLTGNLKRS